MKEISKTAYRLHPKLRIFRNGSAGVNYCRSKNSTLVAHKKGARFTIDTEEMDFSAAQTSIHTLSQEMSVDNQGLVRSKLKKREKQDEMEIADEAFFRPDKDKALAYAWHRTDSFCVSAVYFFRKCSCIEFVITIISGRNLLSSISFKLASKKM